jgi:outer membrane autotransporter protein
MALAAAFCALLAASCVSASSDAFAAGGTGGGTPTCGSAFAGAGGTGYSGDSGDDGGSYPDCPGSGGGGGAAGGGDGGSGGDGSDSYGNTTRGGAGGSGSTSPTISATAGDPGGTAPNIDGAGGGGGGGGGNGNGAGASTVSNATTLSGGDGGDGGNGGDSGGSYNDGGGGGGGGAGGYGAIVTGSGGTATNSGSITGGKGGNGGNGGAGFFGGNGGDGGDGGDGVLFTATGATFANSGTITGGNGGAGGAAGTTSVGSPSAGSGGVGGIGVVGSGLTIINSGSIAGGVGNNGTGAQADAIDFTGGSNVLELRAGSTIVGNVVDQTGHGTFRLGGSSDSSFDVSTIGSSGQYQGFSTFEKTGSSDWTLTGSNSTVSSWSVDDGLLSVNGDMGNTTFTVSSGGSLGGSGTVGGVTIGSGGTIAPGNSPGTLHVNGNVTFDSGSTYQVQVLPSGVSDLILASGAVTIIGGKVEVLAYSGNYAASTKYTIIEAGSVSGKFTSVSSNLAFLTPSLSYDAHDVYLLLTRNQTSFASVAQTPNQRAVAGALSQFPSGNALYEAVLNQSAAGARQAYDALSGEIYASTQGVLLDQSRYVREAILGRLLQASSGPDSPFGMGGPQTASLHPMTLGTPDAALADNGPVVWTQGFGGWANYDGDGNAATINRNLGGFVSGIDAQVTPGWRAGLATGYAYSDLNDDARYSSAQVNTFDLAGYAGGRLGSFALRGGTAWAWHSIDTARTVVFPGFYDRDTASYDGDTGQVFGEAAYPILLDKSTALEPFTDLAYVHAHSGSLHEHGGASALDGSGDNEDVGYTDLGLRAATSVSLDDTTITPHVSAAWQSAFGDITPSMALAFSSTEIGFEVQGVPLARDSALLQAGADFQIDPTLDLDLSYTAQLAHNLQDNGVEGRLDWKFF